jgi:eukaryotic-like serine/threonine-protein kinase
MIGQTLDGYTIEALVGQGSSGRVYQARHPQMGRRVAIKVLRSRSGITAEAQLAEAKLLASINHTGIVPVESRGVLSTGHGYFVMPWLDGEDLAKRHKRAPLSLVQALEVIATLSDALQAAHENSVIHRDIKPANIFLEGSSAGSASFGRPVLLDFGVASRLEVTTFSDHTIVGTPAYMAPEQVRGDGAIGPTTDIYALGATLYELIAGRPPHEGPTYFATLARLVTTPAPRLLEVKPDTPPEVASFVHQMLSLRQADRPSDCLLVGSTLRQLALRARRGSLVDPEPTSTRLGSSVQRLVTSLVASGFSESALRDHASVTLTAHDADTVPLGKHSLVAHFGVRRARGSEATSALNLARRIAKLNARVGVASGRTMLPVSAALEEHPALGEVVERATILSRAAELGSVVCDTTTVELGQNRYRFRELGDGAFIVETRSGSGRAAASTPFVGRDGEFQAIVEAFHRCEDLSQSTIVTLTGPPGIGKSRLQREVMFHLLSEGGLSSVVQQRNDPYGQRRTLGAALDLLRSLLRLPKDASPQTVENSLRVHLRLRREDVESIDVLSRLLSNSLSESDPHLLQATRDVVWLWMTEIVLKSLESDTIVLVVEDVQWADPESVNWLMHLASRADRHSLLLLLTARQDFWTAHPDAFSKLQHINVQLHPIPDAAVRAIVQSTLREANLPYALSASEIDRVVGQSGGSPLFAVELARLAARGTNVAIAPTIEAAIQVSLDSLQEQESDAVGRLSVLGATVWDSALTDLGITEATSVIESLVRREILVAHTSSRFAACNEFQFKHAMVRDVAYARLGRVERRQLHALAANWLIGLGEDAAIVAGHLDLAELPEQGAAYWALAARRALHANALKDALMMAERALTFSTRHEETFSRAQLLDAVWVRLDARASDRETAVAAMEAHVTTPASRIYAMGARARYDAVRGQGYNVSQRLAQARQQAETLGLFDEVARCGAELAARSAFAGEHQAARQEAQRLLDLAQTNPDLRACAVDAWQALAIVSQSTGALLEALEARRNAANAARDANLRERESILTSNLGFALTTVGARFEALDMLRRGIELATTVGSQGALRHGRMLLLCWSSVFGETPELASHLAEPRQEADEAGSGKWTAPSRETLGVLYYRGVELLRRAKGHWSAKKPGPRSGVQAPGTESEHSSDGARILLRMSAQAYRNTDNHDVFPVALGMWALAEHLSKNSLRALEIANEASALLSAGAPSLLNESPIFLTLHDIHLGLGDFTAARTSIETALPLLNRRTTSLQGSPYLTQFLEGIEDNRRLLTLAHQYGLLAPYPHLQSITLNVARLYAN